MINPAEAFSFVDSLRSEGDNAWHALWTIPPSLPYLAGHFPGRPILPGVATVDACVELARRTQKNLALSEVVSAKFLHPLEPGQPLRIEVTKSVSGEWRFVWKRLDGAEGDRSVADLTLRLREV